MTPDHALITHLGNVPDLLAAVTNKDARHRVGLFIDWMHDTRGNWLRPNLADYRDWLLQERQLSPASTAAHLATIRGRYQALLRDNALREWLYAAVPEASSASDRKAFVDETLTRLENAIRASSAPLTVVRQQDDLDTGQVRLSIAQALELLDAPVQEPDNTRGEALRDAALIAVLLCTGLREMEVCALEVGDLRQQVNRQPGVAVREGKGAKARFVPYGGLAWCLEYTDAWLRHAGISRGPVFRGFRKAKFGEEKPVRPTRLSVRAVQDILKRYPVYGDGETVLVAPHDLRRTYARLLHDAGMRMVAIQQNLGHATLDTTLRYIGNLEIEQRKPPTILRPDLRWLRG